MSERCLNCGRTQQAHYLGIRCPRAATIEITEHTLERCFRSGHPRLLKAVLCGEQQNALEGVHIDRVSLAGLPILRSAATVKEQQR